MVSLLKNGDLYGSKILELCGLSTDEKPIDRIDSVPIINGSTYLEMDTKKIFIYSQSDSTWYEM